MNKVAIIGPGGAGKSTLAQELSSILNIKVYHLDRIFWQRDWKEKPRDTRIDILQDIVRNDQWIIEGTYLGTSEPRLDSADTIIFLDINPLLCLIRVLKRHHKYRGVPRRDIPEGCTDKLTLLNIWRVLVFPIRERRTLKQKLLFYESNYKTKEIILPRSGKKVEVFLANLESQVGEKRQFTKTPSDAGNRQLALAKR